MKSFGAGAAAAVLTGCLLEAIPADMQIAEVSDRGAATEPASIDADYESLLKSHQHRVIRAKPLQGSDSTFVFGLVEMELPFEWRQLSATLID